jgi:hypothetical protein
MLAAEGYPIFFSEADELPRVRDISEALDLFERRPILLIDSADIGLAWIAQLLETEFRKHSPPLIVLAARTNRYDRSSALIKAVAPVLEVRVPLLSSADIDSVLSVLARNNLLGELRNKNESERRREFENRAEKQILVAMREATRGKGFDEIIESEFNELTPVEAKVLYLCAAIPTAARSYITREQLLACAAISPPEALDIVDRTLRDIVIPKSDESDTLRLRHAVIAEFMVEKKAPRTILRDAYIGFLSVLSHDMGHRPDRTSRILRLYRRVINHETLCRRFAVEDARAIYESLQDRFKDEAHFWLQFGSLELTYGELDLASNYISQAEALAPNDDFIRMTRAHLFLKKATRAETTAEANKLWQEGSVLVEERIATRGNVDPYPYHIFGSQTLIFLSRIPNGPEQRELVEKAKLIIDDGYRKHPRNEEIEKIRREIQQAYLELALPS